MQTYLCIFVTMCLYLLCTSLLPILLFSNININLKFPLLRSFRIGRPTHAMPNLSRVHANSSLQSCYYVDKAKVQKFVVGCGCENQGVVTGE